MNVLIIEDEKRLAEALGQVLMKNRYTVEMRHDGESGLDEALTERYDMIILDIMLPKMSGLGVLRQLRNEAVSTPVLLLTAKDDIQDKVKGLDSGADDYLTKPFVTDELLARLRALGRRREQIVIDDLLKFGNVVLNLSTYELEYSPKSIKLGLKEFSMMEILMTYGTRVISKEELLQKIWGYDSEAEHNHVEVYISFLRKKLQYIGAPISIVTLRGVGYCLGDLEK